MPPEERRIELNPLTIGIALTVIAVVAVLIVGLMQIFRQNPYGPETRINNIDVVDKNIPQDSKDQVFALLHDAIASNLGDEEPPKSGALVREGTVEHDYNEKTKIYSGSFIVDISAIEQSYKVQLSWSPKKNNPDLDGYPILITCAPKELRIYESQTNCVNVFTMELAWKNAYQLDYTFGATTSQKIRGVLGDVMVDDDDSGPEQLLATVDELSLTKLRDQPDITYQYKVVFGGEIYTVTTRVDETYGRDYIAIYVDGGGKEQGIILTDDEKWTEELSAWLRILSGKRNLKITTEKLNS